MTAIGTVAWVSLGGCIGSPIPTETGPNAERPEDGGKSSGRDRDSGTDADPHLAEPGDDITGHIYNYRDDGVSVAVVITGADAAVTVDDEFTLEANSSMGIGVIGEVFREYTVDVSVRQTDSDATERFEADGIGTLEIRIHSGGDLEIHFIPID